MCSSVICDFLLLNIILNSTNFKCSQNIKLYHFVRTILSIPFCPMPFCPCTILSIPFCPYHFVRYDFVRSPIDECKRRRPTSFTQSMHPALHWICLHNYGNEIVAQYDFSGSLFQNISISVETQYSTRYTVIVASLGERLSTSYTAASAF